jgi:hypothetical protein
LLNFGPILADDVWDDYGNKEMDQAGRLRSLATRILALADSMDELGMELKAYPDADDYEIDEYDQPWDELMAEMSDTFDEGYRKIASLVDELADAATGDFMD